MRFITNGLGGKRLEEQVEELMRLQAALPKRNGGVEIRLAFSPGIFHTKLYLFEHKTNLVAWVGSANATQAGLGGHNEEILTRLEPAPEPFLRYAQQVWSKGRPLEDHRTEVSSLVSFYRTGDIYYRPYAHLRVSVNPFRPLLRRLPPEETAKLSRFRSVYADADAGIGAFNARLVYAANGGRANTSTKPARIRPYAIETCYGYWVPDKYIDQVEDTLQRSSRAKGQFLMEFLAWTKGEGREQTVAAFQDYLRAAKQAMDDNDVEWREYAGDLERVFDEDGPAEQCILDIQEQLGSKVNIEKHSRAFVSGRLPEVWDDAVARSHFEQTFFESLEAEAAKPVRKWPAAEWILGGTGILEQTPANVIKSELERCLNTGDWFESHR